MSRADSLRAQAFTTPASEPVNRPTREWTVMFFLCGDNAEDPVSQRIDHNVTDIERVTSAEHLYVAVQHDTPATPSTDNPADAKPTGARRFIVGDDGEVESELEQLGPTNCGDPASALDFIRWATARCPSERTAIIFAGTGIGESGSVVGDLDVDSDYQRLFTFCDDFTAGDALTPSDLRRSPCRRR